MKAFGFEDGPATDAFAAEMTVLIAACEGSHRATLAGYLEHHGFRVLVTDCGKIAENLALSGAIDMVITGPTMPGLDGYSLTRDLRQALPELPVVLISAGGDFLNDSLLDCAIAVGGQGMRVPYAKPRKDRSCLCDFSHARIAGLTRREREVLSLLAKGLGNKAVARQLSISPRTVENHRAQVMRKTNARSLADLVRLAVSIGEPRAARSTSPNERPSQSL